MKMIAAKDLKPGDCVRLGLLNVWVREYRAWDNGQGVLYYSPFEQDHHWAQRLKHDDLFMQVDWKGRPLD